MMRTLLTLLLALSLASCHRQTSNPIELTTADSAIAAYVRMQDSLSISHENEFGKNAAEWDYRFIKALYKKDSNLLRRIIYHQPQPVVNASMDSFWAANRPNLKKLPCTAAFQFQFTQAFCGLMYCITVVQNNDSSYIQSQVFRLLSNSISDPVKVQLHEQTKRTLTNDEWLKIIGSIEFADFWNLKDKQYVMQLDGSSFTTIAVEKNQSADTIVNFKTVDRAIFKGTALFQTFLLAMQMAGTKNGCPQ